MKVIITKGNTSPIGYVNQYSSLCSVCKTTASGVSLGVGAGGITSLLTGHPTTAVTSTTTYIGGNGNFVPQLEAIKVKIEVEGCICKCSIVGCAIFQYSIINAFNTRTYCTQPPVDTNFTPIVPKLNLGTFTVV